MLKEDELLPPYCVYKSTSVIMESWVRGAPPGTKFNRTKSGWFDEGTFECFFNDILLPRMKKQEGVHVMIGDNLSSHISESVVRKCERHQIKFICLPPNSTHLTQPLDVAYFKPLKVAWRNILIGFRKTKLGQKEASIPKDIFPQLLSQLIKVLKEGNGKANLIAGFRKCGIVPLDVTQLLARLPNANQSTQKDDATAADSSLIEILTELRGEGPKRAKKSKRIAVVPGKSVSVEDIDKEDALDVPSSSGKSKKSSRERNFQLPSDSETDEDDEVLIDFEVGCSLHLYGFAFGICLFEKLSVSDLFCDFDRLTMQLLLLSFIIIIYLGSIKLYNGFSP